MTTHICRDFLTLAGTNVFRNNLYLNSILLFHVGKYTQVGHTNMNMPSFVIASGSAANISTSVGTTYVTIPSASYAVTSVLSGKIISLRSSTHPAFNSGIFRVTSTLTGSNAVIIDYRSTDSAVIETGTLDWCFFQDENALVLNSGILSSSGGYRSRDAATVNRVVLQSPHSSSWQVRLCYEPQALRVNSIGLGFYPHAITISPGLSGSASGDFPSGSYDQSTNKAEHLNGMIWYNVDPTIDSTSTTSQKYASTVCSFDPGFNGANPPVDYTSTQHRHYAIIDDVNGTSAFFNRDLIGTASPSSIMCAFGLPEDEEPLAFSSKIIYRLFVFSPGNTFTPSNRDINWLNNAGQNQFGLAFGTFNRIVSMALCTLNYVGGRPGGFDPWTDTNAADSQFLGQTELNNVEMYAGTRESNFSYNSWPNVNFDFDPRRLGRFPFMRLGRANFSNWTVTTDSGKAWMHTKNGVFIPWSGPTPLP